MPAFVDVPDLQEWLGRDLEVRQQVAAQRALEYATSLIQNYTGQTFTVIANDTVTVAPKAGLVLLPQLPVTSVASVVGSDLIAVTFVLHPNGLLLLTSSYPALVTVTYSHGYATVPDDVQQVCQTSAARALENPTLSSRESVGSFGASYAQAGVGLGAGPYLTASERAVLDRYRVKV